MSEHDIRLRLYLLERADGKSAAPVSLTVLDEAGWKQWLGAMRTGFANELAEEIAGDDKDKPATDPAEFERLKRQLAAGKSPLAFLAPRGVGLTVLTGNEKKQNQIRRRFMLLGQTLDGMRVWDIRRAVQMVHFVREGGRAEVSLHASGTMGVNALYAALFEPGVRRLELSQLSKSQRDGPDYLNVLKVMDIPQALELAAAQAEVKTQ